MTAAKAKVLIVEDDASISEAYHMILTKSGYEVKNAFDGNEGLELISSFKPRVCCSTWGCQT